MHLAHLEEEDASDDEDPESDDPGRIEGVTKEFMVHLARAVKDTQADEKHAATTVAALSISSPIAHLLSLPEIRNS